MKTILGAALGVLLLSGPAMAQTTPMIGVFSQSPRSPNAGNTPDVPFVGVVSTPYTERSGDSQATPEFDYRGSVPVGEGVVAPSDPGNGDPPRDSTMSLVNQTGGGR
jgi:hypothetical protein